MEASAGITKSMRKEDVARSWLLVDASNQTLGRLASQVAHILRGKNKPWFTPHVDCGDFVIVVNAEKVRILGKRLEKKEYFHNTGYPGGARFKSYKELMLTKPAEIIEHAVRGMLPKNRLGRKMVKKLKVYAGETHPHSAQKPETIELKYK